MIAVEVEKPVEYKTATEKLRPWGEVESEMREWLAVAERDMKPENWNSFEKFDAYMKEKYRSVATV